MIWLGGAADFEDRFAIYVLVPSFSCRCVAAPIAVDLSPGSQYINLSRCKVYFFSGAYMDQIL